MRIILDTNILASAVATRGLCADVLRAVLAENELVICKKIGTASFDAADCLDVG